MDNAGKIFKQFQKLPKGVHIDDPTDLVFINCDIAPAIQEITRSSRVCFTRLSLKHLAEKGEKGMRLFHGIPTVLRYPDNIRKADGKERFIVSKDFSKENKPQAVILHIDEHSGNIVVTSFTTDIGYLKNFDLLWRAGTLSL